jgi:lipopolysaccharide/colanic/teichoic acid biosynthesis glycosyltransferase
VYLHFFKRGIDCLAAATGLIMLSPVMVVIAVLIKTDSPGPVLYAQTRIGKDFTPFNFYKFRSMVINADKTGLGVTAGNDPRITRIGRWLRRTKLDELPQLLNVVKGDIALVGPRPELPRYIAHFREEYVHILKVRPGITDYASIEFRNEEALLNQYSDVEAAYIDNILPQKIRLYQRYLTKISLTTDIKILFKTIQKIL